MYRPSLWTLSGLVAGCTATATVEPAVPDPPPGAAPMVAQPAAEAADSTDVPASPGYRRTLAPNCQAPLQAIEEVSRFLVTAGTHATRSSACVDGPGVRVSIDEILVCPARPTPPSRTFAVEYRVTEHREGDTRACPPPCEREAPASSHHRLDLEFAPSGPSFRLVAPASVPGLPPGATAATADHDGNCYRSSPAFIPRDISLG